ncbi:MAG: hypothetical protein A2785_02220 [Candidatus Chisholmbacteria bacterium RIFCSPHIGHO2_01_FULL_49_18]|uniref:Uncharacterized protein n=2 Tax=Candidatus Chisholmiibacteriota TaxID=1817900 RepID=A0A1G1VNF3_9BACT|nr:MAG: hypothetical protein A2785_02220 [Candidatus Chisholmbacteria bacterium RIFCSPHIGHO2_01_FULL_49_18]OGY21535.1 MAG: hypothetical protein A3A65_05435 [Candidatus Chisholmbacteria bacterium RIFCSPLOWO2_01_FULL_49_14]
MSLSAPEEGPKFSRSERIEQSGFTAEDVDYFLELGVKQLPPIEGGTIRHEGTENQNQETRTEYLSQTLGIHAAEIPNPIKPEKMLSERLVSDVLVDVITLCHTVRDAPEGTDPSPWIATYNKLMEFRAAKGNLMDTSLPDGATSHRDFGLKHNFSPGRSENPMRPGYYKAILEALEEGLARKKA